jgi:hypothetical protein
MTLEKSDLSTEESLYWRFLHASSELAKNPNHSAGFHAVAEEITERAITAIRKKVGVPKK